MNKFYQDLEFISFLAEDVKELTIIMKKAFDDDCKRHSNIEKGGPPGYDNGAFLQTWYLNSGAISYKIVKNHKTIGAIAVFINHNHINFWGNIFIDPLYQNKGIGLTTWKFIENEYPETIIWKTETPEFSKRNHHFYIHKCGFHLVEIRNSNDHDSGVYILEKTY